MENRLSSRTIAILVGVLIIVAYSMLTFDITGQVILGGITELLSGLAVIGIPILMFPFFKDRKTLNILYLLSRFIEGLLMLMTGVFIFNPSLVEYRSFVYQNIHIYAFITGALFFYYLLLKTNIIPVFISVWGIVATVLLFIITIVKLFGVNIPILDVLLVPMILNELFLAFWLMFKGFNNNKDIRE